jgi:hypothetical protein
VGKHAVLLVGQLGGEELAGLLFYLLFLVWWAICYNRKFWSYLNRWLACGHYLVPSVHKIGCNWDLWLLTTSLCNVIKYVAVFARWQMSCSTTETLAGQLLPKQGLAIQFCPLPTVPWDWLPSLGGRLVTPPLFSVFVPPPAPTSWVLLFDLPPFPKVGSKFYPTPTVKGKLQFTVYVLHFCSRRVAICPQTVWIMLEDGYMWCLALTCWICRFKQVVLKPIGKEK